MSHAESGASGVSGMTGGGGSVSSAHKKLRRKRKELDALVAEDKLRRKSSCASRHDLLHSDSDDVEYSRSGSEMGTMFGRGGFLGCLPGACALLVLLTTAVGVAATLRLLMVTRRDLDVLQMRLNAVEASGSELPAKFHESHVRLQQLERNHTVLWTSMTTITGDLNDVTRKLNNLENSFKSLQESLSGSPQLTSLPKDVATIQESVATFGSTLQDVQSTFKALKDEQGSVQHKMEAADKSLGELKVDVQELYNASHLLATRGRESVAEAFLALQNQVTDLSSLVSSVNASVASKLGISSEENRAQILETMYNSSISSLTERLNEVQSTCNHLEKENLSLRISNITTDMSVLKESSDRHYKLLQNLTQSVAIVKGVEKKLEGSQVQMASSVSDVKQQLHRFEQQLNSLTVTPTSTVQSDKTRIQTREIHFLRDGSMDHPRRKRWLH